MRIAVLTLALGLLAAGAASANPEPNDNVAQAVGPIAGGTIYGGQIETSNDEDWFFFYTSGQRQVDLAQTNITSNEARCEEVSLHLRDADGQDLGSVDPFRNETKHITYTSPVAAKFYLQARGSGCDPAGSQPVAYQFRVDPADALAATPPAAQGPGSTTPSAACKAARARSSRLRKTVSRLRRKISNARTRQAKRRYRRLLRKRKRQLADVRRQVAARC